MAFTSHGHHISGTILIDADKPERVARCGGPGLCSECSKEAHRFRFLANEDNVSKPSSIPIPPLHERTFTDIGPECFTDDYVISYKGENYYKACDEFVYDRDDGGQSFCVKRVDHPGMYHEAYDGRQKLRAEADGPGELDKLEVVYPRVAATGDPITKSEVKAVWTVFVTPTQESGRPLSDEMQALMAILRHVYAAMPEDEEIVK